MDFSDLEVLGAITPAEQETKERVLAIIRSYTRSFFDHSLKDAKSSFPEMHSRDSLVETVERLSPGKRPK